MDVRNLTADADVFTSNVFYVQGEHNVLVDAGQAPGIVSDIEDLDAVVLTHQHGDHVGELDTVLDTFDVPVYAYADHPRRSHEITDGQELRLGDETFEVVYTPGHADDHVSLLSATTLFSGDVVVYSDDAFEDGSFGRTDGLDQSRERLIQSLEDLLSRMSDGVAAMYPGHGQSYEGDIREVVERALSRAERREPKYPDG